MTSLKGVKWDTLYKRGGNIREGPSVTNIKQYLTSQLDSEVFAIEVCNVREILELATVTRVPKTP